MDRSVEELRELILKRAAEKEALKMARKSKLKSLIKAPLAMIVGWFMQMPSK